jgi:hypothetical protein
MSVPRRLLPLAGAMILVLVLAACASGGAATPSSPTTPSVPPTIIPAPTDSPPPSNGTTDPGGSAGGGSASGVPGSIGVEPGGQAKLIQPDPAALMPHDASATRLIPALNGRRLAVQVEWWSGVAPCTVLAGVAVDRDGTTITLTVKDGVGDRNAMCIEIAELHATIVDLGELEPGTYTIRAKGDAEPIQVTIA